jgi:hypothetical protein
MIRNGTFSFIVINFLAIYGSLLEDVAKMREVCNDLFDAQRSDDINKGLKIFLTRESEHENFRTFRFRHQPQTHLGNDAIVRLSEDAISVRSETIREELPCIRSRHRAHTGPHDLTIWQHDLKTTMHAEMVTIGGISDTAIESVSNNRSATCNKPSS